MTLHLETPRLYIRPFREGDFPTVHAYMSDPEVTFYLEEDALDEAGTRAFIKQNRGEEAQAFPITLKNTSDLVGHIIFHTWFAPDTYEIGWAIHPDFQRNGYASEAARAVLDHAFEKLGAHRVIATCQPENTGSYKVMEIIGMQREAHFRQGHILNGEWVDEYFYAILRSDWRAGKNLPTG